MQHTMIQEQNVMHFQEQQMNQQYRNIGSQQGGHDQRKMNQLAIIFEQTMKNQQRLLQNEEANISKQTKDKTEGTGEKEKEDTDDAKWKKDRRYNMTKKTKNRPVGAVEYELRANSQPEKEETDKDEKPKAQRKTKDEKTKEQEENTNIEK